MMTGTIPDSFTRLNVLTDLELQGNKLSGEFKCDDFYCFFILKCCTSGPIPSSMSNLTALLHLDLDSNKLTGLMQAKSL